MSPSTTADIDHGLWIPNTPAFLGEFATPRHAVEYAVAAEAAGWDGVFLADALGGEGETYFDPWITFAAVAERTETVRLGSWVTPLPRRQPWQVATDLAALDVLSDGRVILGAGLGSPSNFETTGMDADPSVLGARYDEALELIVGLWSGEPVTYDGSHFTVDGLHLVTTPVQSPRPPIAMGCWWPNRRPIERAARFDGLMPAWDPAHYGEDGEVEPSPENLESMTTEILDYYHDVADEPGDVFVVIDWPEAGPGYLDHCKELGATWTLTAWLLDDEAHEANLDRIAAGPPG